MTDAELYRLIGFFLALGIVGIIVGPIIQSFKKPVNVFARWAKNKGFKPMKIQELAAFLDEIGYPKAADLHLKSMYRNSIVFSMRVAPRERGLIIKDGRFAHTRNQAYKVEVCGAVEIEKDGLRIIKMAESETLQPGTGIHSNKIHHSYVLHEWRITSDESRSMEMDSDRVAKIQSELRFIDSSPKMRHAALSFNQTPLKTIINDERPWIILDRALS